MVVLEVRAGAERPEGDVGMAPDLQPDELIEALVSETGEPPRIVGLDGFVGRSTLDGHVRLYRDASVSYWIDIEEEAIVHALRVDVEGKFHPMSVVWVKSDATVKPGTTADDPELVEFLSGGPFTAGGLTDVEVPERYEPEETGLWPNNLRGTIRHLSRPWTACK
jgi:hypothetical protein